MPTGKHAHSQCTCTVATGPHSHMVCGMPPSLAVARAANGFTYIGLLIAVAIMGVGLAATGVVWHTAQQRDRERELLYVGDQFRKAIKLYFNASAQYPSSLDDLLRDPHQPSVVRYLRKIYYDPMTGTQNWGLIKNINDRIIGVYSRSQHQPIKQSNFTQADQDFEGQDAYSKWKFIYKPRITNATPHVNTMEPAPASPPSSSGHQ